MSAEPSLSNLDGPAEISLFDRLAQLVPPERQTEYYRVLAHTRTLGPDDELLRILEAMGILALVTCETPAAIAGERIRLQKLLDSSLEKTEATGDRMLEYVRLIESRLSGLPHELERELDPLRIAKLLGESLRQHFLKSGLPDTTQSLRATVAALSGAQKQLSDTCQRMVNTSDSMVSRVDYANNHVIRSVENTARITGDLLNELAHHVVRIWLPIIAAATFALGLWAGTALKHCRQSECTAPAYPSQNSQTTPTAPRQIPLPRDKRRAWRGDVQ